ncbi:hypothetical protein LJC48_07350 [Desulfovibrio sp. OttesenSCG-928-C06]|nr:hypothetical protein [Desulfovibrio sp. OttesenSCG-928-C06]
MSKLLTLYRGKSTEEITILLKDGDRLITEKEVSLLTGWSRRTLQQHRYAGKGLGYFKLKGSGAVRYLFSEMCAYISESSLPE